MRSKLLKFAATAICLLALLSVIGCGDSDKSPAQVADSAAAGDASSETGAADATSATGDESSDAKSDGSSKSSGKGSKSSKKSKSNDPTKDSTYTPPGRYVGPAKDGIDADGGGGKLSGDPDSTDESVVIVVKKQKFTEPTKINVTVKAGRVIDLDYSYDQPGLKFKIDGPPLSRTSTLPSSGRQAREKIPALHAGQKYTVQLVGTDEIVTITAR